MASAKTSVLIIGAGVSGLTAAVLLAEAGRRVRVIAGEPPSLTTSCTAGAIWGPYLSTYDAATDEWSRRTRRTLEELHAEPSAGVYLVDGVEASRIPTEPPGWATEVDDFRRCTPQELPEGFASGWRYTVPVVDMPAYLGYLQKRLEDAGVLLESGWFSSLNEAAGLAPIVINCAGLGARDLVPDEEIVAVRGELVVVPNPGIEEFFAEHTEDVHDLTYVLPQGDHVVLGGSANEHRLDREPDPEIARGILERCTQVEPRLAGAEIIGHRVGLRPTRPRVRLEHEIIGGVHILHNYGHGGSGLSLSWGCAYEIAAMVAAILVTI
jgi:D-amino-acid oxidase